MTKLFAAAALAATSTLLASTGCVTHIRISENNLDKNAEWVYFISGDLVTKFPGKTQAEVFRAVCLGLDEYGATRTSEDHPDDARGLPPAYKVYAVVVGGLKVSVDITTESSFTKDDSAGGDKKQEWVQATISYGAFGNLAESQKIAATICKHLQ